MPFLTDPPQLFLEDHDVIRWILGIALGLAQSRCDIASSCQPPFSRINNKVPATVFAHENQNRRNKYFATRLTNKPVNLIKKIYSPKCRNLVCIFSILSGPGVDVRFWALVTWRQPHGRGTKMKTWKWCHHILSTQNRTASRERFKCLRAITHGLKTHSHRP